MGKVKLLLDVIGDIRSLADSLQAVVDAMAENDARETEMVPVKENEDTGKLKKAAVKNEHREEADHHALTLSLRSLLIGIRKEGF